MKLFYAPFTLKFKHPFGVSSNTRKETTSIFIKLESEGVFGYGEACLPAYLGETAENTTSFFEKAKPLLHEIKSDFEMEEVLVLLDNLQKGSNAAKAAIDIALHDLKGKIESKCIAELYGLERPVPRSTSFTIGIDKEDVLAQKIKEASDFSILKIKAGTEDDKKLIELIRKYTDKPLYVDVNQGWKDKHFVVDMIGWMQSKNVLLIEQPMPVQMNREMAWVTERSSLPTMADESVKRLSDLEKLEGTFSGVNIKLMKSTGISEAIKMIKYCKEQKLLVLLGCMAESSCATGAMAQLLNLADHVDLDAPLLYKNDPFKQLNYTRGELILSDGPGTGVEPDTEVLKFP